MRKQHMAAEALMIGALVVRAIQLGEEIKRLYKVHKPKGSFGFAQPEHKPWYRR